MLILKRFLASTAILAVSATLAAAQNMGPASVPTATGAPSPAPGGATGPGMGGPLTPGEAVTPGQGVDARTVFNTPSTAASTEAASLSAEDAETMHACTALPNAVMMTNPGCVALMRRQPDIKPKN